MPRILHSNVMNRKKDNRNGTNRKVRYALLSAVGIIALWKNVDNHALPRKLLSIEEMYPSNDVVEFDTMSMYNSLETYDGGTSSIDWALEGDQDNQDSDIQKKVKSFALQGTVDRRPMIVRKQMSADEKHADGELLGCAMSSSVFVIYDDPVSREQYELEIESHREYEQQCSVCFQFSNRQDMTNFLPDTDSGYEFKESPDSHSTATKCFDGVVDVIDFFAMGISEKNGFPYRVNCQLPNGIEELTCREITTMQNQMSVRDDVNRIFLKTQLQMTRYEKPVIVRTEWPWSALMSHDDDRRKIAKGLSKSWDDVDSDYVPKNFEEMSLLHVEGPGYDMGDFDGNQMMKSMENDEESTGGLHVRLMNSLFHFARYSPGSTHMVAVVDGQARRSYEKLHELLHMQIDDLYSVYGNRVFGSLRSKKDFETLGMGYIPIDHMNDSDHAKLLSEESRSLKLRPSTDMTLYDLLRHRKIKIKLVPIMTPSLIFENSICGNQYNFITHFAARYAADYHTMMFTDGDTALIENDKTQRTLNEILYDRFFGENSSHCQGHRMHLIEQYVPPNLDTPEKVLECVADVRGNEEKWKFAVDNCEKNLGNIAARTDSLVSMDIHFVPTYQDLLPVGVNYCSMRDNHLDELMELHLRNRMRDERCQCFVNHD